MLNEALENIQRSAVAAAMPHVSAIPGDDRQILIAQGGKSDLHILPPPRRGHIVNSVEDLLRAANKWGGAGTIWHDETAAVLIVDDSERRDRVTLPLIFSQKFDTLRKLKGTAAIFDQRKLIRLLRHDLAGAMSETILPAVRSVEFKRRNDGKKDIQHGKESLGMAVEQSVQGIDDIPEGFSCAVSVYKTPGAEQTCHVSLTLDIDIPNEEFRLEPLPDEIEQAIMESQRQLHDAIADEFDAERVFWGSPK